MRTPLLVRVTAADYRDVRDSPSAAATARTMNRWGAGPMKIERIARDERDAGLVRGIENPDVVGV
jgi:hypothetical protein